MFITAPVDTAATAQLYESNAESQGFVMNLARLWAWRPEIFEGFAALRAELTAKSSLSTREQALIVCATAAQLGDSYCSLAWGKKLAAEAGADLAAAVIDASAHDALTLRERTLAEWARKVVANPNGTSLSDVSALRDAGFTEKEIFESTVFIAFRLAFSTVNDALGVKPDWELVETVPKEVAAAVSFGRPAATKLR